MGEKAARSRSVKAVDIEDAVRFGSSDAVARLGNQRDRVPGAHCAGLQNAEVDARAASLLGAHRHVWASVKRRQLVAGLARLGDLQDRGANLVDGTENDSALQKTCGGEVFAEGRIG
nr:hypothetical protein [Mycolicibacterium chitae]